MGDRAQEEQSGPLSPGTPAGQEDGSGGGQTVVDPTKKPDGALGTPLGQEEESDPTGGQQRGSGSGKSSGSLETPTGR